MIDFSHSHLKKNLIPLIGQPGFYEVFQKFEKAYLSRRDTYQKNQGRKLNMGNNSWLFSQPLEEKTSLTLEEIFGHNANHDRLLSLSFFQGKIDFEKQFQAGCQELKERIEIFDDFDSLQKLKILIDAQILFLNNKAVKICCGRKPDTENTLFGVSRI